MLFRPLLPDYVRSAEMPPLAGDPACLHPDERQIVERAVDKRRREFAAGRQLAHRLLADAGSATHRLLPDKDRVPVWPMGIVGSITHCNSLCAVAIARASDALAIGLDVEPATPLKQELLPHIVREAERARLDGLPEALRPLGGILTFSIKEAVYKAIYPERRIFLDFHQVEIDFEGEDRFVAEVLVPEATLPGCERIRGRFRVAGGHVVSAVVLPRR
ncbi:MAG: 4'-phosphopantetheinyl transferase superfamily protein [Lysobacteraceae bacterium]|nr:MAG: 4'-phosphopantetheinyl transferase superfamily protein [Xanthomonadaceae bacterium]